MTISRRWFIAGLAITGAAAPAVYFGHRELTRVDEPITPGEATVDLADTAGQQIADQLRGLWTIRFTGRDAGLDGLPADDLEVWLDIAPRGRGVRGYLDTAQVLHSEQTPRYRILADLVEPDPKRMYWRLIRSDAANGQPDYEFSFSLDEVWGMFGNAGSGTLSGRVQRLDRALALPEQDNRFVALKRTFPEARQRIPLNPTLLQWLVSPEHRLFHQLWHASRDTWHELSEDKRNALRGIGWQPGQRDRERDARGPRKDRNGSGVDFFHASAHAEGCTLNAGLAVVAFVPDAAARA